VNVSNPCGAESLGLECVLHFECNASSTVNDSRRQIHGDESSRSASLIGLNEANYALPLAKLAQCGRNDGQEGRERLWVRIFDPALHLTSRQRVPQIHSSAR
jgi:hypothetical protein